MLQGVLHVNNTLEFLSKCHFHTFVTSSVLLRLKSWSANGASHHSAFMSRRPTISHRFLASFGYPVNEFSFKEMRTWGSVQDYILLYLCLVWTRRNRREELNIPLCNPSGGNRLLRQNCTQNSVKHQRQSSSAKAANDLNMLTVPAKRFHQTFDWIASADLTGGALSVGCGWTAIAWNS